VLGSRQSGIASTKMQEPKLGLFVCRVCGKPVMLEDSKIDAAGHPLHDECAVKVGIQESLEDQEGGQ
jgi:hypothetical protein